MLNSKNIKEISKDMDGFLGYSQATINEVTSNYFRYMYRWMTVPEHYTVMLVPYLGSIRLHLPQLSKKIRMAIRGLRKTNDREKYIPIIKELWRIRNLQIEDNDRRKIPLEQTKYISPNPTNDPNGTLERASRSYTY